jgi:tetratricopeptide (TPR) repeat protein
MNHIPTRTKQIQNLRNFTVQIRHARKTEAIVGTGFIISPDGLIVTCAHVIAAAGINPRQGKRIPKYWDLILQNFFNSADELADRTTGLTVYCPQAKKIQQRPQKAILVACPQDWDDDVVLLKLLADKLPEGVNPAKISTAQNSEGHHFRSFGYCSIGDYNAMPAEGKIIGFAECQGRKLRCDPLRLDSKHIENGMSGAAVLDTDFDRVVGIISETYDSGRELTNRDTSFALSTDVLVFDPFLISLESMSSSELLPPTPDSHIGSDPNSESKTFLRGAPPSLENEWVGRIEILNKLSLEWESSSSLVISLIGFGGEGKSSIARQWFDNLLNSSSLPQPVGVFWWNFYDDANADSFFESLLRFLVPQIDPNDIPSTAMKARIVKATLKSGRYLFILDGLEVLQYQDGDQFGLLKSKDLQIWLREFSAGAHKSLCLITSRTPVIDLIDFTTYMTCQISSLSNREGAELLQKLGVKGNHDALTKISTIWNGYALALNLLGQDIVENYSGDINRVHGIDSPLPDEPRYERIGRVLCRYDKFLSQQEKSFLLRLSAFRLPIPTSALDRSFKVFENSNSIVHSLSRYGILRFNSEKEEYTLHPLIRKHYLSQLNSDHHRNKRIHFLIGDYYLAIANYDIAEPSLNDLVPFIQAVHHYCQAGKYDKAYNEIFFKYIHRRERRLIIDELCAYETYLDLLLEFFPNRDHLQEPLVGSLLKGVILNSVGLCLASLGKLHEAVQVYQRSIKAYQLDIESNKLLNIDLSISFGKTASVALRNLSELYIYLGQLSEARCAADEAKEYAHTGLLIWEVDLFQALTFEGWVAHLQGDFSSADLAFKSAEKLSRKYSKNPYLFGLSGIFHASHLRKTGYKEEALNITLSNLNDSIKARKKDDICQCHRLLGDIYADLNQVEEANRHYDEAIKLAQTVFRLDVLIEALISRGYWFIQQGDFATSEMDLNEALEYAVDSGFRIYEADIRVVLAKAAFAKGDIPGARSDAQFAQRASAEMSYYWGQVESSKLLSELEKLY